MTLKVDPQAQADAKMVEALMLLSPQELKKKKEDVKISKLIEGNPALFAWTNSGEWMSPEKGQKEKECKLFDYNHLKMAIDFRVQGEFYRCLIGIEPGISLPENFLRNVQTLIRESSSKDALLARHICYPSKGEKLSRFYERFPHCWREGLFDKMEVPQNVAAVDTD